MIARNPAVLAFLRDLALSLPAFYVRKQRAIVDGNFVPVPADALRPKAPDMCRDGEASRRSGASART